MRVYMNLFKSLHIQTKLALLLRKERVNCEHIGLVMEALIQTLFELFTRILAIKKSNRQQQQQKRIIPIIAEKKTLIFVLS